jgi:hypothetical protein
VKDSTKRLWLGKYRGRKAFAFVALIVLLGLLIGFGFPALVDAAWSAERSGTTPESTEAAPVCGPGNQVECKKYVRAFKAGRYGRSRGLPVQKMFASPKVARKVWVTKITRKIQKACATPIARPSAEGTSVTCTRAARMCDRCLAYEMYRDMVQHATCSGRGHLDPDDELCRAKYPGTGPQLTKRQIQIGGAAILCAGNVAIAARGGAGLLAGLFGGVACGWALWEAVDPG